MSALSPEDGTVQLLGELAPGQRSQLLHLLACPACRKWAVAELRQGRRHQARAFA